MMEYRPEAEIIPWNAIIPGRITDNPELTLWRKQLHPNKKDFPILRDDAYWFKNKKKTLRILSAYKEYQVVQRMRTRNYYPL